MSDAIRTCILSREEAPRQGLIRLALAPDGTVLPDIRAKAPGRGAWIGVARDELEAAIAKGRLKGALARAFKGATLSVPADLPARIAEALERAMLDRLGLELRAGLLIAGSDRIEEAARAGRLHLLLHAADAGADGNRRLDQAWRVGRDAEGSGERGMVIPLSRAILSMALGRENMVHIGITDRAAAARVRSAIDRWLHFTGSAKDGEPCETASQGASAFHATGVGVKH